MSKEPQSLSEFVTVLLKSVAETRGSDVLPENPRVVHAAFYDLQRKFGKAFPELNELHFVTAGAFPYSADLTEVLDTLQLSRAITRDNPTYESFRPVKYNDSETWLVSSRNRLTKGTPQRTRQLAKAVTDLSDSLFSSK